MKLSHDTVGCVCQIWEKLEMTMQYLYHLIFRCLFHNQVNIIHVSSHRPSWMFAYWTINQNVY